MKPNEIKKAMHCCIGDAEGKNCFKCPLREIEDCLKNLNQCAIYLIKQQENEIERLKAQIAVYEGWGLKNDF